MTVATEPADADIERQEQLLRWLGGKVAERNVAVKGRTTSERSLRNPLAIAIRHLIEDCLRAGIDRAVLVEMAGAAAVKEVVACNNIRPERPSNA